jgi:tryptophan synthase alpha chain
MSRLSATFARLKSEKRAAFIPFVSGGDPDMETSAAILEALPGCGADIIELGMPFSDPMADGPAVQASSTRALKAGATLPKVIALVKRFRKKDDKTPIVLMGYFNPIHAYGTARFARDAAAAGVDGLIVVDLPPEEDDVLRAPAIAQGLDIIRLATPTSDDGRLGKILDGASGFVYYVAIAGVTGTKDFDASQVEAAIVRIRKQSGIPVVVGFGVKTPGHAHEIARLADGVAVGSAIVNTVAATAGQPPQTVVKAVTDLCTSLAQATHKSAKVSA